MSKHILIICQYFPPEMGAPSARTYEHAKIWVERGCRVTVLTAFPHHPTGVIPKEYSQHFFKIEEIDGIRIIRTYVYPVANKGFVKRTLSYLSFMTSAIFLGSLPAGKVDVVVATSPQFFVAVAGYVISRVKRKPFVFEVRDLWPESIIQLGQIKNRFAIRMLEAIEVFLYKKAAKIVAVTDSFIPIIEKKGIAAAKMTVIKNGVDLTLFSGHSSQDDLRRRLGLEDKFVISYIGTHGLSHALDRVVEVARQLSDEPQFHFLFVGEGAEKENLIGQASEAGISNVTFLSQVAKKELPAYYALSDVVLIPLKKLELFRAVIPSKMFEIMAMGRPIILSVDGEAREIIVDKALAGIFVEPENTEQLRKAILHLFNDPELRSKLGKNGRAFVEEFFDRKKMAGQYLQIFDSLTNSPAAP